MDRRKRTVLLWSAWYLALMLVVLLIAYGLNVIASVPACKAEAGTCELGYSFFATLLLAALALPILVTYVGAVLAALISAAKVDQRGWFVGLLAYLIASALMLALAIVRGQQPVTDVSDMWTLFLLVLIPCLLPIVTLIYGLRGRGPK
jgi:hypothetical protein